MNENDYYYQHNREFAILSETNNNNNNNNNSNAQTTNDMTSQHEISDDTGTSVVSITEEDHDGDEYDDDYLINHDINNNHHNNNSFESHDDDDDDDDDVIDDEKFNYRYSLTDNTNNNNDDDRRASSGEMSSGDEMSVILSPPSPHHGGIGDEDLSILIPQSSSHSILSSSSSTITTTTGTTGTATTSSSSLSITTTTATTGLNNHSSSGRVLLNKKSHGSMTKIHSIQSLPPIVDISSSILSPSSSQSPSRSPSRNSSSSNNNHNSNNSNNSNSGSSVTTTTKSDGSTRVHSRYILEALRQSYVEDVQYMKQQSRRFKTTATSSSSTVQQQYAVDQQQQADENFMTDEYAEDYDMDVDEYDNDNEDDDELTVVRVRVSNNNNNNSSTSNRNSNGKRQSVRTTTTTTATTILTNNNSVALSQMYLNHRKSVSIQSSDHMNSNGSSSSNSASHNNNSNNNNNNNNRNSVKLLGRMNHLMWNDRSRSMSTGHLDAHNNNGHNQNNSNNKRNSLLSRKGSSPSTISNTESIFNNMNGYGSSSSSSNSGNGNSKMGTQKLVVRNYARQLTAQVNLGTLPEELLFVVFTWLEPEDLGRVASVNRIWNRISELDLLWESIAYCYYPDETARAVEIKLETNNSLLSRQPEEPRSRKSIFQTLFTRSNSSSSGLSPLPQPNVAVQQIDIIDYSRLKDCTFFKDIFTQVYASDVQLLRTGLWTSDTWKPKKSPWKKDDYEFVHDKLARTGSHTSLSPTASDMNEMLNGGVSSMNVQVPIKVVVVGDGSVGKTSLLCRYSNNYFPEEDFLPTIFDNFTTSTTYMNQTFNVSLYDTAGTEDYDRLRPLSYIGADIFLLCVDLVNAHSLENGAKKWLEELNKHAPGVPIVLCGTKMDLRIDKKYLTIARRRNVRVAPISYKMGCDVAKKIGAVAYTETSALTGHGVDRAFGCVMRFGCEFFLAQQKHYAKVSNCGIS